MAQPGKSNGVFGAWLIWGGLGVAMAAPIALAAASPLLAWRDGVYIAGGFAGIIGFCVLLAQPLIIAGALPGLTGPAARRAHAALGALLTVAVLLHVAALWITSPPDVIDALLFRSPTPFAIWGVLAMWAVVGAAALALARRRWRIRPRTWRRLHLALAGLTVAGTIAHAVLIEGTMEPISKIALSIFVAVAALNAVAPEIRRSLLQGPNASRARPSPAPRG